MVMCCWPKAWTWIAWRTLPCSFAPARGRTNYSKRSRPSSLPALWRRSSSLSYPTVPPASSSSGSTSTEPVQSAGGSTSSRLPPSCVACQSSRSISSTVPSKYCSSIVPSSSSKATISNESPPRMRYQLPMVGFIESLRIVLLLCCSRHSCSQLHVAPERCHLQERISCAKHHARTGTQVFHRVFRGGRADLADPGVFRTHRRRERQLQTQDGPEVSVSCKRNTAAFRGSWCRLSLCDGHRHRLVQDLW